MQTKEKGPDGLNRRDPSTDETTPKVYNSKSNAAVYGLRTPAEAVTHRAVSL
jgi:hypothetical protein